MVESGAPARSSRLSDVQKALIVGFLGWVAIQAARSSLFPLLPVIGEDFSLTGAQQGAIVSTYFFLYVAMQIPVGLLGDWIGLKRVLIVMSTVAGIALVGVGLLSSTYVLLLTFAALAGLGSGGFFPTAFGLAVNAAPQEQRGRNSAVVAAGMAAGVAFGLWTATPIKDFAGSWHAPFLVMAAFILAVAALGQFLLRNKKSETKEAGGVGLLFHDRAFVTICVVNFFVNYGSFAAVTWGPTFFSMKGMDLSLSAIYTSIIMLAAIPSGLMMGRISDRIGRKKVSVAMFAVAGLALALMARVDNPSLLFVVLAVYGATSTFSWNGVGVSWVADMVTGRHRCGMGSAIGILNFSGVTAAIVAPIVSGWLMDITHALDIAFYLGAVLIGIGVLLLMSIREQVGRGDSEPAVQKTEI